MIQRMLRIILVINLATFAVLFVTFGSPLQHHRGQNIIADWWVFSTAAALILFILEIARRLRRKVSTGLWLDATLLGAWVCAMGFMIALGAVGFAGF